MTLSPPPNATEQTAHRHQTKREDSIDLLELPSSPSSSDDVVSSGPLDCALPKRTLPWVANQIDEWGERVSLPEWDADEKITPEEHDGITEDDFCCSGDDYRQNNGWIGTDLCHSVTSPVRISHFAIQYKDSKGGVGTKLTGVAHFTQKAESHSGYCHGGSMTSVMDDVIGWTSFFNSGKCVPWSGFTAQVNVSLRRPIPVGSYLKIVGEIIKTEGRKTIICKEQNKLTSTSKQIPIFNYLRKTVMELMTAVKNQDRSVKDTRDKKYK
eukprot:scaffold4180_cov128-Skeletonema_menzelii.AAC.3